MFLVHMNIVTMIGSVAGRFGVRRSDNWSRSLGFDFRAIGHPVRKIRQLSPCLVAPPCRNYNIADTVGIGAGASSHDCCHCPWLASPTRSTGPAGRQSPLAVSGEGIYSLLPFILEAERTRTKAVLSVVFSFHEG